MFAKKPVEQRRKRKISWWIGLTIIKWMLALAAILIFIGFFVFYFVTLISNMTILTYQFLTLGSSGVYRTAEMEEADETYDPETGTAYYDNKMNDNLVTFVDVNPNIYYIIIYEPYEDKVEIRYSVYAKDYDGERLQRRTLIDYDAVPEGIRDKLEKIAAKEVPKATKNVEGVGITDDAFWEYMANFNDDVTGIIYGKVDTDNLTGIAFFLTIIVLVIIIIAIIIVNGFIQRAMYKGITVPIKAIDQGVRNYKKGKIEINYNSFTRNDELFSLAKSFDSMAEKIEEYTNEVAQNAADQEHRLVEMSTAMNIQRNMLPDNFKEVSKNQHFEICAFMKAAKEVGGDFYDFFMTDKDTLWLVMADVSGKGIPGAMFMTICCTIIRNSIQMEGDVAEITRHLNDSICSNNEESMFVTVWLGKYTISTGVLEYCNAGHEYPAIYKAGEGKFELQIEDHDIPCGIMEGYEYEKRQMTLERGDRIFLYTDGIAEAMDVDDNEYGEARMLENLNGSDTDTPEELLNRILESVESFTKGAEQSDDLTMLSVYF